MSTQRLAKHLIWLVPAAVLCAVAMEAGAAPRIHEAVRVGDLERVTKLLDRKPHLVHAQEEAGWPPLHFAAQQGHDEIARLLLARGADLEARNARFGATPLHLAVSNRHESTIVLLLVAGTVVDAQDDNGWTPLHRAAVTGFEKGATLLLAKGATVGARSETGVTPVEQAKELGHARLAELLRGFEVFRRRVALPFEDDFAGGCLWPVGETDAFSYGCLQDAYAIHLKKAGPVHVTRGFGWFVRTLSARVDVTVASGRGTEPGAAILGIGCLTDESHGYIGLLKTDGVWAVMRLDDEFTPISGGELHASVMANATHRLQISCETGSASGTTIGFEIDGREIASVQDQVPHDVFNGIALYADTFPGDVTFGRFAASGAIGPSKGPSGG